MTLIGARNASAGATDMVQNRLGDFEPDAGALQTNRNRSAQIVHVPRHKR
jgi:hypothetical protein